MQRPETKDRAESRSRGVAESGGRTFLSVGGRERKRGVLGREREKWGKMRLEGESERSELGSERERGKDVLGSKLEMSELG